MMTSRTDSRRRRHHHRRAASVSATCACVFQSPGPEPCRARWSGVRSGLSPAGHEIERRRGAATHAVPPPHPASISMAPGQGQPSHQRRSDARWRGSWVPRPYEEGGGSHGRPEFGAAPPRRGRAGPQLAVDRRRCWKEARVGCMATRLAAVASAGGRA
jgi:hypothetical protein